MGKDKIKKFAEIATFPNVHQLEDGIPFKGQWAQKQFGNNHPVILELACGKGEYTVNLARLFPEINFIGIDYKGNRIWRGAKDAIEENIPNVAFLRIQIETILDYFESGEVDEIWITFPDPQPQKGREKKRLTYSSFMEKYVQILKPEGLMHLKTDSDELFTYTLEQLAHQKIEPEVLTHDLYRSNLVDPILSIKTYYERKYLSIDKSINYVKWKFNR